MSQSENNDIQFNPHRVVWTKDKIDRFWNYYVSNAPLSEVSVEMKFGKALVDIIKPYLKPDGNNLNYGCGAGYMLTHLFEAGFRCAGLDTSDESLRELQKRFANNPKFSGSLLSLGVPNTDIPDNTYDAVLTFETVEHLFPEDVQKYFDEFYRILKPGGYLMVTTRNNENLEKKTIICPDCGGIFHRVQHMMSYTPESISALAEKAGLKTEVAMGTLLAKDISVYNKLKNTANRIHSALFKVKMFKPDLVYIGRK